MRSPDAGDVVGRGVAVVASVPPDAAAEVADVATTTFRLDFDDAHQYTVAERLAAVVVSFDSDFDRTERGRTTPDAVPRPQAADADERA